MQLWAVQVRWCCPNRLLATGERIDGLTIGGRQLLALRQAVEKLAGPEAVAKMPLLLHVAEEMEEPVLADLRARNLYGSVTTLSQTLELQRTVSLDLIVLWQLCTAVSLITLPCLVVRLTILLMPMLSKTPV